MESLKNIIKKSFIPDIYFEDFFQNLSQIQT